MSSPGTNTSATGGPMTPNVAPAPLEGIPLLNLFQETLCALSGIASDFVRPRFQAEPPNIPQYGSLWMAFGIHRRPSDWGVAIAHDGDGNDGQGDDNFQRQERIHILCSFYDTGSTGDAYNAAAQLRDSIMIPQNMEALGIQNIAIVETGELIEMPSLLATQWMYRVDLEIIFTRNIDRQFRILNLLSAEVDLHTGNNNGDPIGQFTIGVSDINDGDVVEIINIQPPP